MLMRSDPFRDLDRLAQQVFGSGSQGRPATMAMDAYRDGDRVVVHFDIPGVDPSSIELTVEKNVLAVTAERQWKASDDQQLLANERQQGTFSRQLFLGDGLDLDSVGADYDLGVLTVTIPVAEQAKPRKVEIAASGTAKAIDTTAT